MPNFFKGKSKVFLQDDVLHVTALFTFRFFIIMGVQRVTNTLLFRDCPTIQFQGKNLQKKVFKAFKSKKNDFGYCRE
ncbi:hypothetical protein EO95_17035 [Methanosarcina sp. 1.H.T.1A.1]|nr:hypothetical protein EO92_11530 [Methanosarcina sp. 2.H.A.1B.4]KKH99275.1 hypothetical protein EO95_17035 [Methanosarcina sp. 1.H.T.1A.1]